MVLGGGGGVLCSVLLVPAEAATTHRCQTPSRWGCGSSWGGGLRPGAERDLGCWWAGLAPGSGSGFGGPDCPPSVTLQKSPPAPGFVL